VKLGVKKNRIWELDFFRGISILLVVVDHAMYDFARVFDFWRDSGSAFLQFFNKYGTLYLDSDVRFFWRPAFLFVFFFTSGLCTAFSRNNFLRGARLVIVAAGISLVTYGCDKLFGTDVYAMFGVIHCIAAVILIYAAIDGLLRLIFKAISAATKKAPNKTAERIVHIVVFLSLGIAFAIINHFYNVPLADVSGSYEAIETDSKILGLFFYCENWWTADYFPLFPYISFFFLGAGFTRILYENKKSLFPSLDGVWHKVFTLPGRYSIFFYLGGQLLAIGLGGILSLAICGRFF